MKHQTMQLTVPASEEWALVVRMALSGAAALCDLDADAITDLRAAGDEAFALLLCQPATLSAVTLCCEATEDGLCAALEARRTEGGQAVELTDPDIARLIIETLVRDVQLDADARGVYRVRIRL